jgi:eukaryotic-like serine/threonine-protein kinase
MELTVLLGAGAFGAVWEASLDGERSPHVPVAVKVSHSSEAATIARFRREKEVLESLGPPHVPALIASGTLPDGRMYLAMERLSGRTLAEELVRSLDLPRLDVVAALGSALLDAVAGLHRQGVFHRDLKPENVFLVDDKGGKPTAKLIDFGLALRGSMPAEARTSNRVAMGTPEYMAPERIAGEDGDLRSDVYALGVMLFELLTLRPPFVGDLREIEYAHLSFRPPPPSRFAPVPEPLEAVVLRCLAKEAGRRFADAVALKEAFVSALASSGVRGPEGPPATGDGTARPGATRQKAALIFLHHLRSAAFEIQTAVAPFGGQLAHLAGDRCVCVFTHQASDHPGQRALSAAEALSAAGLSHRLIVDVRTVSVKPRPNGPPRISSPAFLEPARFPRAEDPAAILITTAARETLSGVACRPSNTRPEHFVLLPRAEQDLIKTVELTARETVTPLLGREEALAALFAEAARALGEKRPRVASVLAEQGLGKTRFRLELASRSRLELPEAQVIDITAGEEIGQGVDEALAELLLQTLDLPRLPPASGGLDLLDERIGASPTETAAAGLVLGWLSADDPAVRSLRAAPGALRANAARAGKAGLLRAARRRPLLVLLDDAHWANDALLDAIEQATVSELPLWVCAFARPAFATSRPEWGQRASSFHSLRLGPLDATSAGDLCRHLLEPATHVPQSLIDRLVERTEGVPLLIFDLLRGLRREGFVRRESGGGWVVVSEVLDTLQDSPLTEWLAHRELDALPAELAAHARLLSLLPAEFTLPEVEGLLSTMARDLAEAFPMDAGVATQRLRKTGLLVRRPNRHFGFRSEVIRECVARTVSDTLGKRIHRSALAYYTLAPESPGRLARLAWHAAAAGEQERAAAANLALAEAARERHNYLEADLLYSRSLVQLPSWQAPERLRALRGRGIMRYRLGRHEDSLSDLAEAHELAIGGSDPLVQVDVLLEEATALDWLFEWQRSRQLAERARELLPAGAPPELEARVLLALGRSVHRFNQDEEAAALLRTACRLAEAAGDAGYEVQVVANLLLGFLLPFLGLTDEAEERLRQVQIACEAKGDELHLVAMWNNRSCLWIVLNHRERFMADNAQVRSYAQRMGSPLIERYANLNSANFLYWRGEHEDALPFVRRMIEIDERHFRQGGFRPDGAVLLARILWTQGAEAEARATIERIHSHQVAARAAEQRELLLPPNDEMLLDMTTLLVDGGDAPAWEALVSRARQVAQGQELVEVLELAGVAAERRGEPDGARRWWGEALEVGRRIPNVMGERIQQRLKALG